MATKKYQKFRKSERTRSCRAKWWNPSYLREGDLKVKPFVRLAHRNVKRKKNMKTAFSDVRGSFYQFYQRHSQFYPSSISNALVLPSARVSIVVNICAITRADWCDRFHRFPIWKDFGAKFATAAFAFSRFLASRNRVAAIKFRAPVYTLETTGESSKHSNFA